MRKFMLFGICFIIGMLLAPDADGNDMTCELVNRELAIYRCESATHVCYVKYKSKMHCEPKKGEDRE